MVCRICTIALVKMCDTMRNDYSKMYIHKQVRGTLFKLYTYTSFLANVKYHLLSRAIGCRPLILRVFSSVTFETKYHVTYNVSHIEEFYDKLLKSR